MQAHSQCADCMTGQNHTAVQDLLATKQVGSQYKTKLSSFHSHLFEGKSRVCSQTQTHFRWLMPGFTSGRAGCCKKAA